MRERPDNRLGQRLSNFAASAGIGEETFDPSLAHIKEPQAESRLRWRVNGGFATAILLTALLGFLSWHNAQEAAEAAAWVAHTREVSATLELTFRHLLDVESGGRGYALSGLTQFLEVYESGKHALGQDLETLRILIADNPNQELRLNRLRTQARRRIEAADTLVASRRESGMYPPGRDLELGKQLMDAARATIEEMEAEETRLLKQRSRRTDAAQHYTSSAIWLGSILGIIFLSISGLTLNREIGISARARAHVNALNADLERRVAERTAALGESESRLAGVIQSATDSIITVDEQQRIVLFNATAEKIFRCPAAEAIGQPITRFIPWIETGETVRAIAPDTISSDKVRRAVRADGQEFQAEASISQTFTGGKKLFTLILRDVTERKEAENRLAVQAMELAVSRETLEEQARVLDLAPVMVRDMDGRIDFWPRGAEHLYGIPSDEAVGMISHKLLHTEFPEPLENIGKKLFETGRWEGELMHHKGDGTSIYVASVWVLYRDENGDPVQILEVNTNITGRKQAEERLASQAEELSRRTEELSRSRQALEEQQLILRSVLDSMSEGLVAADEKGKFILWNPAAVKIVGLGPSALNPEEWNVHYGVYLPDRITPFPPEQNPLFRAIRGEPCTAELFIHNPELSKGAWIELSANPLKDTEGKVCGGVAAFRDVTQRKIDEAEIRKLNDELEERVAIRTAELAAVNKDLESFTYSVSHDLRAPLRHMSGFTKILVEDFGPSLPEEAQQHLQRIESAAHRMGRLVDELLNLARVGRQALAVRATALDPIVREILAMLEPESAGRQIEWKITELPFVECDPTLIGQVFQNLIGNALKYSRPRSPAVIEIGQIQQNGNPTVFVRDNGVGFSMEYADKLFGVFQRLHRPEDFEGTGVGLATVQRIIQKHGGRIWAEAELDRGATFYFTLKAWEQFPEKAVAAAGGQL